MAYRVGGGSRGGGGYEEHDHFERSRSRAGVREYEHEDVDIRVRERERVPDRVPAFLREDRRGEAGPMVLRARDVETVERPRRRSPSVARVRTEMRIAERQRSPSPPPRREIERDDVRIRTVERVRSPSRVRTRIVERERERSPSPAPVRTRFVERARSPSPVYDRERIRIIERERERMPSPSPSPPPPPPQPQVIKGPTIEREVITHYRDIDHGVIQVRQPSPVPAPPPVRSRKTERERDTEIDIYTSRRETEVDIHRHSHSRGRARSPSIERRRPQPKHYHDDEVLVRSDRGYLEVDIDHHHHHSPGDSRRRARSAAPIASPPTYDYEEADYITSRINERGRMGEALHGATRDWAIVDVPPGTERVRMDGVGGGAAEVTWSKYSGVRRAQFLPDGTPVSSRRPSEKIVVPEPPKERERERERDTRVSVSIYDERERERERDPPPPKKEKRSDMWTEITKDLVTRDAIEELGYEYEETEYFYYILQYLRYEDVLELVKLSDSIRRQRKDRVREIEWEREYRDDWDRDYRSSHRHRDRHQSGGGYDHEVETEVVYDSRPPIRGYLR